MKNRHLVIASLAALSCLTGTVHAVTSIPDLGDFGDDDGTELWIPGDTVTSFAGGIGSAFGPDAFQGFGFYYSTDPGTLISIFDPGERDFTPDGSDLQVAEIDFTAGTVWDVDDAEMQSTFSNTGGSIGFWLALELDGNPATGPDIVYTQSALNGGLDILMSLPSLADPNDYAIVFVIPEAAETTLIPTVVQGITPVPVPAALPLMIAGLLALGLKVRSRT